MDVEKWISIIGSIASVGAAIWAYFEAIKASKSASRAQQVRDEIIEHRKIVETSYIYLETKKIISTVSKIGPSANPKFLKGIDINSIVNDIEKYSQLINEHNIYYDEFSKNTAKELFENINKNIEALSCVADENDYKKFGILIYNDISMFLPIAKSYADGTKERIIT